MEDSTTIRRIARWFASLGNGTVRLRYPPFVTAATVAAVVTTAVQTGIFRHSLAVRISESYGFSSRGIGNGAWQTVATSQLLTRDIFMCLSICVSLVVMLGLYEALAGSARALLVAATCAAAGPLVVAGITSAGSSVGIPFFARTMSTMDYGASAITAGAAGAVVGLLRNRWLAAGVLAFVIGGILLHHQIADWEHLVSASFGMVLGRVLGVPRAREVRHGATPRNENRVLCRSATAAVVAVGALGFGSIAAAVAVPASSSVVFRPLASPGGKAVLHPPVALSPSEVIQTSYWSPSLNMSRTLYVILPPGYAQFPKDHYPVVELLHGDPGDPTNMTGNLGIPELEDSGSLPPFIAVAPDGNGPAVDAGDFADTSKQKLGTAVSTDLRAYVDSHYRTDKTWTVMGLSSGGFGAAYLGMHFAGMYTAICPMSGFFVARTPAFAGEPTSAVNAASPLLHASASGPRTLIVFGADDTTFGPDSRQYFQALTAAGQRVQMTTVPGTHEWSVWKAATPLCLHFLLGPSK